MILSEEKFFCAHCEHELPAEPYLAHFSACLAFHVEHWPIHAVNWGALGASGCPELCGEPHGELRYRCPECGNAYKDWGKHRHQESLLWREG